MGGGVAITNSAEAAVAGHDPFCGCCVPRVESGFDLNLDDSPTTEPTKTTSHEYTEVSTSAEKPSGLKTSVSTQSLTESGISATLSSHAAQPVVISSPVINSSVGAGIQPASIVTASSYLSPQVAVNSIGSGFIQYVAHNYAPPTATIPAQSNIGNSSGNISTGQKTVPAETNNQLQSVEIRSAAQISPTPVSAAQVNSVQQAATRETSPQITYPQSSPSSNQGRSLAAESAASSNLQVYRAPEASAPSTTNTLTQSAQRPVAPDLSTNITRTIQNVSTSLSILAAKAPELAPAAAQSAFLGSVVAKSDAGALPIVMKVVQPSLEEISRSVKSVAEAIIERNVSLQSSRPTSTTEIIQQSPRPQALTTSQPPSVVNSSANNTPPSFRSTSSTTSSTSTAAKSVFTESARATPTFTAAPAYTASPAYTVTSRAVNSVASTSVPNESARQVATATPQASRTPQVNQQTNTTASPASVVRATSTFTTQPPSSLSSTSITSNTPSRNVSQGAASARVSAERGGSAGAAIANGAKLQRRVESVKPVEAPQSRAYNDLRAGGDTPVQRTTAQQAASSLATRVTKQNTESSLKTSSPQRFTPEPKVITKTAAVDPRLAQILFQQELTNGTKSRRKKTTVGESELSSAELALLGELITLLSQDTATTSEETSMHLEELTKKLQALQSDGSTTTETKNQSSEQAVGEGTGTEASETFEAEAEVAPTKTLDIYTAKTE